MLYDLLMMIRTLVKHKEPTPLTPAQVAAKDLNEARLELLREEKARESAMCAVLILKERIKRLEEYTETKAPIVHNVFAKKRESQHGI